MSAAEWPIATLMALDCGEDDANHQALLAVPVIGCEES